AGAREQGAHVAAQLPPAAARMASHEIVVQARPCPGPPTTPPTSALPLPRCMLRAAYLLATPDVGHSRHSRWWPLPPLPMLATPMTTELELACTQWIDYSAAQK